MIEDTFPLIAITKPLGGNCDDIHGYDRNKLAKRYLEKNPTMKVTKREVKEEDFFPIY